MYNTNKPGIKDNKKWVLNKSLLFHSETQTKLADTIRQFLQINIPEDSSFQNNWDTLTLVMRGHFISEASYKKKEKEDTIWLLQDKIIRLEKQHKTTGNKKILN
ncbi:UNVERIFIED_CONTAM: hypothetical protein K2H54_000407 [Gekko kuhli]